MTARRALKLTHVASTIWFVVCVAYILVRTMIEHHFKWWLIFSLSGHSAILIFILVSVYLFALVRDMSGTQQIQVEHPFTSTHYYMGFYVAAPLLGGLAGVFGMIEASDLSSYVLGVALGTLGTTFCVWVVLDPATGLIEMLLPASRAHRTERLAQAEVERKARQEKREKLLADAVAREQQERERWQQLLRSEAEHLAALLEDDAPGRRAEREAVDIGARAWHLGGLNCMRQLRDMALTITREKTGPGKPTDYISYWWDGIGDWRRPSLD
jgi:signal transduction histidine kinase